MHDKSSLFSSRCLGRNGYQADYEKLTIRSKQKTVSQISRGWDNFFVVVVVFIFFIFFKHLFKETLVQD